MAKPIPKETVVTVMQPELRASIDKSITALAASEKVTKAELTFLSRNVLMYLVQNGSTDIACVDRLLSVCTPMNRETARLFFDHFLPWTYDAKMGKFGGMVKGEKSRDAYILKVNTFLADEANDIWAWAADNIEIDKKDFNLANAVTKAIELALNGKKEGKTTLACDPISASEILQAVIAGGVSASDLMVAADDATAPSETAQTEEVAAAVH